MLMDLEAELKILKPKDMRLTKDDVEGLTVELENGGTHKGVRATLLFPLTGRDEFVRLSDAESNEIGIVRSIDALDASSRDILAEELAKAYFIPQVTRIERIREEYGTWVWDVETLAGARNFEVRDRRDIRFLDSRHVVIRDVDGNRYEIPNLQQLDDDSLHMLETEL